MHAGAGTSPCGSAVPEPSTRNEGFSNNGRPATPPLLSDSASPSAPHLLERLRGGLRRHDLPVPPEVVLGAECAAAADLFDEEVPDILLLVVDDGGVGEHGEAAATALAVVVQGDGEGLVIAN